MSNEKIDWEKCYKNLLEKHNKEMAQINYNLAYIMYDTGSALSTCATEDDMDGDIAENLKNIINHVNEIFINNLTYC